jgi:hypothetical protein
MTTRNEIMRLVDRLERTRDVLDEREQRLWNAVMPVFRSAAGITWMTKLYSVRVTDTDVIARFGHPDDSPTEMVLPIDVFEQDDPEKAAKNFETERRSVAKKKSHRERTLYLLKELAAMNENDDDDDN